MTRRKLNRTAGGFAILLALFVALLLANSLRRTAHIVLPPADADTPQTDEMPTGTDSLTVVEIRPDTVQSAVRTLERPSQYRRMLSIQQFWSGGSATQEETVTVFGDWTRVDWTLTGHRVRHSVTNGETTYLWYDQQTKVQKVNAGEITADMEQHSPTYEDVLELPVEQITQADYQNLNGTNCIYVETAEDEAGYQLRYWVSVENGLLVASEKQQKGQTVYRLWQTEEDTSTELEASFILPDGTNLLETESKTSK